MEQLVGQGSFGRVFRARDGVSGERVALKEFVRGARGGDGFVRELGALFDLRHEHILQCHSVFMSGDFRYVVYEYMDRGSLRDVFQGGLPVLEKLRLLREAALGISHAHQRNFVHRDLKPENVLLKATGGRVLAKVADFGVSVMGTDAGTRSSIGSPAYMAPEQFYDAYDLRVDIYAMGVMLFEAITGARPFIGGPAQIMLAHLQTQVRIPDWVPGETRVLLTRALAKHPDDRFHRMEALVEQLDVSLERDGETLARDGWPRSPGEVDMLRLAREAVLVLQGGQLTRYDRRGRSCEVLDGIDMVLARDDHYLLRKGSEVLVVSPRARARYADVAPNARFALSADSSVAIAHGRHVLVCRGSEQRSEAFDGNVLDVCFVGPDQELASAIGRGDDSVILAAPFGSIYVRGRVQRLYGALLELWLVAELEAGRKLLITPSGIREVHAPSSELETDGRDFIGVTAAGELMTIHVGLGRVARTGWDRPLTHVSACVDGFAWVTCDGQLRAMP